MKTHDEVDNAKAIGFYTFYGFEDGTFWNIFGQISGTIFVIPIRTGYVQFFFPENEGFVARRICKGTDTDWKPWEVFNPPMLIGKEYRTTERYLGKPVYAKAIDLGTLPNSTKKVVSGQIQNAEKIIDYWGTSADQAFFAGALGGNISRIEANPTEIAIVTTADLSMYSAFICVKYTKTTD